MSWNYYQYRKNLDYPIYLRFKADEASARLILLLTELGFNSLLETESKKISLQRSHTRVLTVQAASARALVQINGSDSLDQYGLESLALQQGIPLYTYRRVGLMSLPHSQTLWDLAYRHDLVQSDLMGLRIMLVRFLSQSLCELGVISYWGKFANDTLTIMKQGQSNGEAVFIDGQKKILITQGFEQRLPLNMKIIRRDKEVPAATKMSREELISYLSVSTCLLSFNGITPSMRAAIFELGAQCTATIACLESNLSIS
jgi:hypothetical protein